MRHDFYPCGFLCRTILHYASGVGYGCCCVRRCCWWYRLSHYSQSALKPPPCQLRLVGACNWLHYACLEPPSSPRSSLLVARKTCSFQEHSKSCCTSGPTRFLLALLGLYAPIFYIADYALEHGMITQPALYMVAVLNGPSFLWRLIPNFAGDKLGRFNITIFTYAGCAILLFCWTAATTRAAIIVWIVFFGFFSGAAFPYTRLCCSRLAPSLSLPAATFPP